MNDELSMVDSDLADQIKTLAFQGTSRRDAAAVAARAFAHSTPWWRRRLDAHRAPVVAITAAIALAVSVGTVGLIATQQSSQLATARVDGLDYTVSVPRTFNVPVDALSAYAGEVSIDPLFEFDGLVAYRVRGVDPKQILVMKLLPDQRDDAGLLGDYVLLVRGPDAFSLVCAYFDPLSAATARACRKS